MRGEDTWMMLLYAAGALWLLRLWTQDMRAQQREGTLKTALPGAYPASLAACLVAALGAVLLVALETGGEYMLEIHQAQETIAVAFLLVMLAAAVIEEIIFRGYCVITHKGRKVLWASVVLFSIIFALIHPYLWEVELPEASWAFWEAEVTMNLNTKGLFSTLIVFINSLWFYAVRFMPNNPQASLLPCFVAHATSNLAVFAIKAWQGFVV